MGLFMLDLKYYFYFRPVVINWEAINFVVIIQKRINAGWVAGGSRVREYINILTKKREKRNKNGERRYE